MAAFSLDDSTVLVVIGSGASGAVVANRLAQRGVAVVCLEAGRRLGFEDIVNNEPEMFGKFTWLDERIGSGDALARFPVWNCKTVGGTTMHWTATSLRLQPHEMKARTTYGEIEDTNLVDWPAGVRGPGAILRPGRGPHGCDRNGWDRAPARQQ